MLIRSIFPLFGLVLCSAIFAQQKEIKHVPIKSTSLTSGQEMYACPSSKLRASAE
jgi:hypothetical protein